MFAHASNLRPCIAALRRSALRCLLAGCLLCLHCTLASAFMARLDVHDTGQAITGQVSCSPGGQVAGEALLDVAADARTGPLLSSGGRATGHYELRLVFKGTSRGSAPESLSGTADLSGVFTFDDGKSVLVMGTSDFTGRGSVAAGLVRIEAPWRVSCMGGGLVSPQELALTLPPYTLQQCEVAAPTPAAAPQPGAAVADTPPASQPGATGAPSPAASAMTRPAALPTALPLQPVAGTRPAAVLPASALPATLPTALPLQAPAPAAADPAPVLAGVPAASGGRLDVPLLNVLLGPQQTADGRCVQPASLLPAVTKAVYAYIELKSALPGGQLLITLYHGPKVKEKHLIAAGAGDRFIITFYPTNTESLPQGQWSLQLAAGGRDLGCLPFTVGSQ